MQDVSMIGFAMHISFIPVSSSNVHFRHFRSSLQTYVEDNGPQEKSLATQLSMEVRNDITRALCIHTAATTTNSYNHNQRFAITGGDGSFFVSIIPAPTPSTSFPLYTIGCYPPKSPCPMFCRTAAEICVASVCEAKGDH